MNFLYLSGRFNTFLISEDRAVNHGSSRCLLCCLLALSERPFSFTVSRCCFAGWCLATIPECRGWDTWFSTLFTLHCGWCKVNDTRICLQKFIGFADRKLTVFWCGGTAFSSQLAVAPIEVDGSFQRASCDSCRQRCSERHLAGTCEELFSRVVCTYDAVCIVEL